MTQTSRGGAPLLGRFPVADPAAVAGRQRCHCLGRRSRAKGGEGRSQRGSADDFMVILWEFMGNNCLANLVISPLGW